MDSDFAARMSWMENCFACMGQFLFVGSGTFFNITIEFMKALEERLKQAIDGKVLESYINGHSGDMMTILYNAV